MSWLEELQIDLGEFPQDHAEIATSLYSNEMEFLQELYNKIVESFTDKLMQSDRPEDERVTFANNLARKICLPLLFLASVLLHLVTKIQNSLHMTSAIRDIIHEEFTQFSTVSIISLYLLFFQTFFCRSSLTPLIQGCRVFQTTLKKHLGLFLPSSNPLRWPRLLRQVLLRSPIHHLLLTIHPKQFPNHSSPSSS